MPNWTKDLLVEESTKTISQLHTHLTLFITLNCNTMQWDRWTNTEHQSTILHITHITHKLPPNKCTKVTHSTAITSNNDDRQLRQEATALTT